MTVNYPLLPLAFVTNNGQSYLTAMGSIDDMQKHFHTNCLLLCNLHATIQLSGYRTATNSVLWSDTLSFWLPFFFFFWWQALNVTEEKAVVTYQWSYGSPVSLPTDDVTIMATSKSPNIDTNINNKKNIDATVPVGSDVIRVGIYCTLRDKRLLAQSYWHNASASRCFLQQQQRRPNKPSCIMICINTQRRHNVNSTTQLTLSVS